MIIKLRKILLFAIMPCLAIMFMSTSGGGKGGNKKIDPGNGCEIKFRDTEVVLYQMYQMPPNRINNWAVPASPSLWTGAASASSLFSNPNNYYCSITISTTCDDYSETYTWDPDDQGGTLMTISVPENYDFRISVEYWEQCGPYWGSSNSPTYARGRWYSEITQNYSSSISITQWLFTNSEGC